MKLYVIFGQRQEKYNGEYGLESYGCMTEYEYEENPNWLHAQLEDVAGRDVTKGIFSVTLSDDSENFIRKELVMLIGVKSLELVEDVSVVREGGDQ